MFQNCSFCLQPSVIHCMNRSVAHKHSQEQDKSFKIIQALISSEESPWCTRYKQAVLESDIREFMNYYMSGKELTRQNLQLLEYYKYRIFVPVFIKSTISDRAMSYYYEKLKLYYNKIKRQLNITVELSSTSPFNTEESSSRSVTTKEDILKGIKLEIEQEKQTKHKQSIINYKTESKALEQLVSYLKLNSQFQSIKTLRTEDCFDEQSIFQETTHKKASIKAEVYESITRKNIKSKLFKKIVERAQDKKSAAFYETYKEKQRPRSKSIKIIKLKQSEEIKGKEKKIKIAYQKAPQLKEKGTSSTKTLPVRNNSLNRITQNHYSSPTKHKEGSTQKYAATTISTKNIRSKSIQNIKVKNYESTKIKGAFLVTQVLKFQTTPIKSSPVSPSAKKTPRPEIKVTQNDNIMTIRKKKLEALKEKTSRK